MVQPCNSIDMVTAWKNSHLILSEESDIHVVVNLFIAINTFPMHILTSHSINEILLVTEFNELVYESS